MTTPNELAGLIERLSPTEATEPLVERAVIVCPQCEGEGGYPDGVDEDACHTDCTRCGGNGWIVDLAALSSSISNAEPEVALPITTWAVPSLERAHREVERLREQMAQPSESGIDESLRAVLSALEIADQELESVAC